MRIRNMVLISIIGIILIAFAIGCESKDLEIKEESTIDIESEEEASDDQYEDIVTKENIMDDYNNMIAGDREPFDLTRFIDENIKKTTEEEATEMIIRFEEVQEDYLERYIEELFTEDHQVELLSLSGISQSKDDQGRDSDVDNLFFDQNNIADIKDGNLKELLEELVDGKYKLINMEGAFYPIIDYEALKDYGEYISEDIREYIHIKALESNIPSVLDAELNITFDELSERIIQVEDYMGKYPLSKKRNELISLYGTYLYPYILGTDNTPIYEYGTKKIKDEVLNSYKNFIAERDTKTSQIVAQYMDIIKENENKIDDDVLSKGLSLRKQAISEVIQ